MKQRRQNRGMYTQQPQYAYPTRDYTLGSSGDLNGNGVPDYLERGYPVDSDRYQYRDNFYHTPEWQSDFQWYHPSQLQGGLYPTGYSGFSGSRGADWNGNGIPDNLERGYGRDRDWNTPVRSGSAAVSERDWDGHGYVENDSDDWNGNGVPDYLERGYGRNRDHTTAGNGWVGDFGHLDDDEDLLDDMEDLELGGNYNDNRWSGAQRPRDYGYDARNDFVGHDWNRGSTNQRYSSM